MEKKKLELIQKEIDEKRKASRRSIQQEQSVKKDLKELEDRLATHQKKLQSLGSQLKRTGVQIQTVRRNIYLLEREMETRRDDDLQLLRRLAIEVPSLDLPDVDGDGYLDRMTRERGHISLVERGHDLWKGASLRKGKTEGTLGHLENRYQGLSKEQTAIARQKEAAAREDSQKREVLTKLQKERASYEAAIHDLETASVRVKDLLSTYERSVKPTPDTGFALERGRLPWPIDGEIVVGYGRQKLPDFEAFVERKGVEIVPASGKEVHAIFGGTVVYADDLKGYGKMVIVDHGGKYYSVYGHASQILVSKGNPVKKGQTIASLTGVAEGNTLYFEIRHGGGTENPVAWLKPKK
jgi:septal ring factor EnvC (AmiA/AmiB activator)